MINEYFVPLPNEFQNALVRNDLMPSVFHRAKRSQQMSEEVPKMHTVQNLHFLSKNSTLISRENCRTRENVVVLDFLAVDDFDFTKKNVKKFFGGKLLKMFGFCQN